MSELAVKPYEPFDQQFWLGDPPYEGDDLEAWEKAHGHDVRLKCYVEFGCRVIESTLERELDAAQTALGLASEEVRELRVVKAAHDANVKAHDELRELRAEVATLRRLFDDRRAMDGAEVARLTEALRHLETWWHKALDPDHAPQQGCAGCFIDAALSPASTESVRITPSGEAVRLASSESERGGVKLEEDLERAIRETAERRGETVEQFVVRACGERLHADTYAKG